jgi:putative DNA primase/helicase
MIDLRILQRALGGVIDGGQVVCPGPGHSRSDRSLAVKPSATNADGFIVFSHCNDSWALCKNYVRERLGLPPWRPGDGQDRRVHPARIKAFDRAAIDAEAERRERTEDDLVRIARAQALWNEAVDPRGTAAEQYLHSRRLDLDGDLAGRVLRLHPHTPWRDEDSGATIFVPCLIAAFRNIDDSIVTAVHRIRVDQPEKWPKTQRRMLGIVHRAAVMLDPIGTTLAVGEGVETCAAARQLGHAPAWALGSVGAISFFPVLDGVEQLKILGEAGEASARATEMCGRRWYRAGRKVRLVMPDIGSDLNDELMQATA